MRFLCFLMCFALLAAWVLPATAAPTKRAAVTFVLHDYLHHTWTNELVTYRVARDTAAMRVLGPDGKPVPAQITAVAKGAYDVAFIVETLPADGSVTYTLASSKTAAASLCHDEGNTTVLDAGLVAVRVPKTISTQFPTPQPFRSLPAPLLAVRGRTGAWLGAGTLLGDLPVTSVISQVTASGPVYAESTTRYAFPDGGFYRMTIRVVKGQDAVTIREEFDTPKVAVGKTCYSFNLSTGLTPDRVAAEIRTWRKRTDVKTTNLGTDYKLDFDASRKEMSILGYVNWWPETARRATFYRSDANLGDAISILPARIGWWRNPMGMYVMTEPGGVVRLNLPLYIDQDWVRDGVEWGNPYYTGKVEEGWKRSAGRRAWVLHCATPADVFPKEGASAVNGAIRKYCDLPLDKVKDWTLEWKADSATIYPRLYVEPGKLEEIRARVKANPRWNGRLGQYNNRPISYAIQQNEKIGNDLLHAVSHPSWNTPNDAQGSLESLRSYVDHVWNKGYMGFAAPNNAAPMLELIKFDAAMSVATATPEEKAELRRLMAFVVNTVYDQDWHSTQSGVHLGNPNMPPRQEHHLGVAGCVLPDHPLAEAWRKRGEAEARRELDDMVREAGTWRECPHYQYEAAMYPMFQSAVPLAYNGGQNIFKAPKLKATWDYLLNITTPPDPRFGARLVPAFGNGSWEMAPLFGWLANLTREDDPAFSRRMQWMWVEQGKPDWMAFSETILNPNLPMETPALASKNYPGFGAILRSGFPAKDEAWVAFRAGDNIEHYNHGDQNSFMFYAKGAPLVIQFGSQYTPYFRGAWYFNRVSIGHQLVKDGMVGGTEFAGAAGNADYPAKMTGFNSLGAVDVAVSRHATDRQTLLPDDKDVPMPPNFPSDPYPIPQHTWQRTMALVKSFTPAGKEDPTGPLYLVMRDTIDSAAPLPSEWNIWTLADKVEVAGNLARCRGQYGVDLDVYMAEPAAPKWFIREDTSKFLAGPSQEAWQKLNPGKPWVETLKNLRASAAPGAGYLAILFPRTAGEAPPTFATLLDGKGVTITHRRGTDTVIMSPKPVAWTAADRTFTGTACVIRQEGAVSSMTLLAPGEITFGTWKLTAVAPLSVTLRDGKYYLTTDGPAQIVEVNGKRLEIPAGKMMMEVK